MDTTDIQPDHHRPFDGLRRRATRERHLRHDIALEIAIRRLDQPR